MTRKIVAIATGMGLLAGMLAACSDDQGTGPIESGSPTSVTSTLDPSTPAPTAEPTTPAPVTIPPVGDPVPAADVDAVRAAGGNVYVSPGGGDGIVVAPGQPLPAVMVADFQAAAPDDTPGTMKEYAAVSKGLPDARAAAHEAGIPVVTINITGAFDASGNLMYREWAVGITGIPNFREVNQSMVLHESHGAAQAKAAELAATYGAQVIDAG